MTESPMPAGLLRRLGAIVSDSLVVFALLALATLIVFVPILNALGKQVMTPAEVGWFFYGIYVLTMLCLWFAFYGYFWKRSGQTIGMRAWRIRVESSTGALLTWPASLKRWTLAVLPWLPGLVVWRLAEHFDSWAMKTLGQALLLLGAAGFLLMYSSPARLTWHDRMSRSRAIVLPKL